MFVKDSYSAQFPEPLPAVSRLGPSESGTDSYRPGRRKLPLAGLEAYPTGRAQNARGCAPGAHFFTKNNDLRRGLPKLPHCRKIVTSNQDTTYENLDPLWLARRS
jgi:hypothetical protein